MKQEIAFAWADKLDSDEYKQDKDHLRTPNGFCCLGVLCDMYSKAHPEKSVEWIMPKHGCYFTFLSSSGMPPNEVTKWAGLDSKLGRNISPDDPMGDLTTLNDSGKTFPEIAKLIRENWERL